MRLLTKFYDADAGNTGAPAVEVLTPELKAELGQLRSIKELYEQNGGGKTAEQLAKEAELDRVNMRVFSVENDIMKDEDFTRFETIKGKKDEDLVYEDFSSQWEKDNPGFDPTTKESEKRAAFEAQYHINSENKTLKERGQKLIATEAAAMRSPLESSYQKAKSSYDENKMMKGEIKGFNEFVSSVIKENTPDKVVVKTKDGDEEVDIDVDLTEDQRKEIEKMFSNPKTFQAYISNKAKRTELQASLAKKIQGYIRANNFDRVAARGYEVGKGRGVNQGSTVGADNSFGTTKNTSTPSVAEGGKSLLEKISESFEPVREKMGL